MSTRKVLSEATHTDENSHTWDPNMMYAIKVKTKKISEMCKEEKKEHENSDKYWKHPCLGYFRL